MKLLLYGALLLGILGTCGKQFAMKKCGAIAGGTFNSACINLARAAICLIVSLAIWGIRGGGITDGQGHLLAIVGGTMTAVNLLTWILASSRISLVLIEAASTLTSMIIPVLLAPALYPGETVSVLQWIGCVLVFVALFLFSDGIRRTGGRVWVGVLILVITAVSCGLAAIIKKYYTYYIVAAGKGNIEYYTLIGFAVALIFFAGLFSVLRLRQKRRGNMAELPYRKTALLILFAAACLYIAELFATYAAELPSAIYYPLTRGLAMLATFLLDVLAFGDKITPKKLCGLAVILVAIVLVNL